MTPTTGTETARKTFDYPVEVKLTDKDLLTYADELAALDDERSSVDTRLQQAKGDHKSAFERITERQGLILNRIRTKKETRPTPCFNEFNYVAGTCDIVRADTGEVVNTRKLTEKEYKGDPLFDLGLIDEPDEETDEPDEDEEEDE